MKTNKSFTKRLRVTRRGKIISRAPGQDHFNARENGQGRMRRRRSGSLVLSRKTRARFLGV